jgi:hypothetical protein
MGRCRVDKSIQRVVMHGFDFPLGVYPIEEITPREGFTLAFESADGGYGTNDGEDGSNGVRGGGGEYGSGEGADASGGANADGAGPEGDASTPPPPSARRTGRSTPSPSPRPGPRPGARPLSRDDDEDRDSDGSAGGGGEDGAGEGGLGEEGPGVGRGDDGEGDDDLEEWPDRYVWDIAIKASRVEALCRSLFSIMPGRLFPILDVLGADHYREIDPYVAYDLVGQEKFLEGVRRFRGYLFEDGLVGFGAMVDEPFMYVFVDEHKIVTVRAQTDLKERIDKVLAAFDLEELPQIDGADAAVHEHRSVLDAPDDRPDLLTSDEIVEELRELWGLELNVDPYRNVDDAGNELGVTPWRCVARLITPKGQLRYAEVLLTADRLVDARNLAAEAAERRYDDDFADLDFQGTDPNDDTPVELDVISADRLGPEAFGKALEDLRASAEPPSPSGPGKGAGRGPKAGGARAEGAPPEGALPGVPSSGGARPPASSKKAKRGQGPDLNAVRVWALRWVD